MEESLPPERPQRGEPGPTLPIGTLQAGQSWSTGPQNRSQASIFPMEWGALLSTGVRVWRHVIGTEGWQRLEPAIPSSALAISVKPWGAEVLLTYQDGGRWSASLVGRDGQPRPVADLPNVGSPCATGRGTSTCHPLATHQQNAGRVRRVSMQPLERIRADLTRPGREDSNLRHSAPKDGGRDRRQWQRLANIEKYSRSGRGVVQRFAEVGSKFEECRSCFAPGTGASHERQACGGSTCRPTLRRRGRPHPTSLRSDGLQALLARNPRARPHPERRSRRPGGFGVIPGCSPSRVRLSVPSTASPLPDSPKSPVSTAAARASADRLPLDHGLPGGCLRL